MNKNDPVMKIERQSSRTRLRNPQMMRAVRILSWVVTLAFLVSLDGAIHQALVNGNPLPLWAWLRLLVLFAVAVGLGVMVAVYRGVREQVGPFDVRPSALVAGELINETRREEASGANSLRAEIKMLQGVLRVVGGMGKVCLEQAG